MEIDKEDLIECKVCSAINLNNHDFCRRCGNEIIYPCVRTAKSWAYLITAIIAYIPANIYPMLITMQFGHKEGSTIIGGVILLWSHGSYPIAIIIFVASIFIPIMKFLLLFYLFLSAKYDFKHDKKVNKHKLFIFTELIGPWSMIDVFVVAILAALINLSNVQILAGTASTAFAISVFFTLLSAHSFDINKIH